MGKRLLSHTSPPRVLRGDALRTSSVWLACFRARLTAALHFASRRWRLRVASQKMEFLLARPAGMPISYGLYTPPPSCISGFRKGRGPGREKLKGPCPLGFSLPGLPGLPGRRSAFRAGAGAQRRCGPHGWRVLPGLRRNRTWRWPPCPAWG